jgi:hypothetical protein
MTALRLAENAFHTEAHHMSIASSRALPTGTAITSNTVIAPRSPGSTNVGQLRFCRASCMWAR